MDIAVHNAETNGFLMDWDYFTIEEMLSCSGINLDHCADQWNNSHRNLGITLLLKVKFTHDAWGKVEKYEYHVTSLPLPNYREFSDPGSDAPDGSWGPITSPT